MIRTVSNPCDQCSLMTIQGIVCHETGCPNAWRDPLTGEPNPVMCFECGTMFAPEDSGQSLCDDNCSEAYYGTPKPTQTNCEDCDTTFYPQTEGERYCEKCQPYKERK